MKNNAVAKTSRGWLTIPIASNCRGPASAIFASSFENELPLPADHGNFVQQQNGYSRQRDLGGQRIASEEVEGHGRPAGASRDQSAADIDRSQ